MNIIGIIPARYASTRFPGKPLIDIQGQSMIQRVYNQASKSKHLQKVIVATDDHRIYEHVKGFGGEVIMTSEQHVSGTDRCAEVIQTYPDYDMVINIQGDEPFIDPEQIDLLAACFLTPGVQIATLIKKIHSTVELTNTHIPKVIINYQGQAIYFSRQTIPFQRNQVPEDWLGHHIYYKHIGIYGYRSEVLRKLTGLLPSRLELAEGLEQLRWLENGYNIQTAETDLETLAVDTEEDLQKITEWLGKSD